MPKIKTAQACNCKFVHSHTHTHKRTHKHACTHTGEKQCKSLSINKCLINCDIPMTE